MYLFYIETGTEMYHFVLPVSKQLKEDLATHTMRCEQMLVHAHGGYFGPKVCHHIP